MFLANSNKKKMFTSVLNMDLQLFPWRGNSDALVRKKFKAPIIIDFLEKVATVNSATNYQRFSQNSPYLLNELHAW